jgi:hypothetical protein
MAITPSRIPLSEYAKPGICERCHKPMLKTYGSGRFCNKKCARAYSNPWTRNGPRKQTEEALQKIREASQRMWAERRKHPEEVQKWRDRMAIVGRLPKRKKASVAQAGTTGR